MSTGSIFLAFSVLGFKIIKQHNIDNNKINVF